MEINNILKDLFYNKLNLNLKNNLKEIIKNTIAPYNTYEEYIKHGDIFLKNKMIKEKNVGDKVWFDGYTSMAQQNAQETEIEAKDYRYDQITGEYFPIYLVFNQWFDGRNGGAYNNEDNMYYIEL